MSDIQGRSILVVDDEVPLREAIAFDFKRKGYQIYQAPNGKEAFNTLQREKIDLVISDIRMPGGDGIELLTRAREANIRIPIILITGYADITPEDALKKGAQAVFSKPFDRKALFAEVEKHLNKLTANG